MKRLALLLPVLVVSGCAVVDPHATVVADPWYASPPPVYVHPGPAWGSPYYAAPAWSRPYYAPHPYRHPRARGPGAGPRTPPAAAAPAPQIPALPVWPGGDNAPYGRAEPPF